jgi:hypothetical protein
VTGAGAPAIGSSRDVPSDPATVLLVGIAVGSVALPVGVAWIAVSIVVVRVASRVPKVRVARATLPL